MCLCWNLLLTISTLFISISTFLYSLYMLLSISNIVNKLKIEIKLHPAFSSVLFSRSVVSDSLRPHEPQHTRPPCPSPTPGVHSNSCPLSRWCHPTISSSIVPFSSCPQSFPALGSFQMSQFFASGGQSIGVSASKSVLPVNIQDWFPLGWTGWISLQSKGLSRVFSQHHGSKASILQHSAFFIVQLSDPYMTNILHYSYLKHDAVCRLLSLFNVQIFRLYLLNRPSHPLQKQVNKVSEQTSKQTKPDTDTRTCTWGKLPPEGAAVKARLWDLCEQFC